LYFTWLYHDHLEVSHGRTMIIMMVHNHGLYINLMVLLFDTLVPSLYSSEYCQSNIQRK